MNKWYRYISSSENGSRERNREKLNIHHVLTYLALFLFLFLYPFFYSYSESKYSHYFLYATLVSEDGNDDIAFLENNRTTAGDVVQSLYRLRDFGNNGIYLSFYLYMFLFYHIIIIHNNSILFY